MNIQPELPDIETEIQRLNRMLDYSVQQEAKRSCEVAELQAQVWRLQDELRKYKQA